MPGLSCEPVCALHIGSSEAEVVQNVYNVLERALASCQRGKRPIMVGLSGGDIVHIMMEVLPSLHDSYLERARFVFCDEGRVPFDNLGSTFDQFVKLVLPRLQPTVSEDQLLCIDRCLKNEECTEDYEAKLRLLVGGNSQWSEMDILVLGIGEDGHTCSLFPDDAALMENRSRVASVSNAPSERVTLTMPVLNHARNTVFIATGASKAGIVKVRFGIGPGMGRKVQGRTDVPAGPVPKFVPADEDTARQLAQTVIASGIIRVLSVLKGVLTAKQKIFESAHESEVCDRSIPPAMLDPPHGPDQVHWILDKASASMLKVVTLESEETEL